MIPATFAVPSSICAVILDLDGTLIDTASEIAVALNRTFAEFQLSPLPKKSVANLIGRGVHSMVERALQQVAAASVDVDAAVARFESHYAETVGTEAERARDDPGAEARKINRGFERGLPIVGVVSIVLLSGYQGNYYTRTVKSTSDTIPWLLQPASQKARRFLDSGHHSIAR